jgi:hypothetical protein
VGSNLGTVAADGKTKLGPRADISRKLLAAGADVNAVPSHSDASPLAIAGSVDTRRETMREWLRSVGAR